MPEQDDVRLGLAGTLVDRGDRLLQEGEEAGDVGVVLELLLQAGGRALIDVDGDVTVVDHVFADRKLRLRSLRWSGS